MKVLKLGSIWAITSRIGAAKPTASGVAKEVQYSADSD